jgi:tRNA(fMet)-specific endonuclease VapC
MLDADTVSYGIRGEGQVGARLLQHRPSELCITAITLAELRFGAEAKRAQKLNRSVCSFIKDIAVIPFDEAAADRYALVAAALARRGEPVGALDTVMAAHALSLGLTVVTNNTRHFSRVPGLTVENWL